MLFLCGENSLNWFDLLTIYLSLSLLTLLHVLHFFFASSLFLSVLLFLIPTLPHRLSIYFLFIRFSRPFRPSAHWLSLALFELVMNCKRNKNTFLIISYDLTTRKYCMPKLLSHAHNPKRLNLSPPPLTLFSFSRRRRRRRRRHQPHVKTFQKKKKTLVYRFWFMRRDCQLLLVRLLPLSYRWRLHSLISIS